MNDILVISMISMGALGLILAIGLTIASKKFAVKEDPTTKKIEEVLPGANCGACGFPGCFQYAEAVADKKAPPSLCSAGGPDIAIQISDIMGVEAEGLGERKVAHVFCGGTKAKALELADYEGVPDCRGAHALGGNKACGFGCLGFGSCVKVCPFGAMKMSEEGLPIILKDKCTACGKCIDICPRNIISLVPDNAQVFINCISTDKGGNVRKVCSAGCIGCRKCEKACNYDAIKVKSFLASIDQDKCTSCRACIKECPVNCISLEEKDVKGTGGIASSSS